MGYCLGIDAFDALLKKFSEENRIFAPIRFEAGAGFSDLDVIRYGEVSIVKDIVFDEKSCNCFKEALLPIAQTLFYFTEEQIREADAPTKGVIIFLRSCDMHALKRLDEIYLGGINEDYYYKRLRESANFVLMGCAEPFENCFCVDMETNISDNYDLSVDKVGENYLVDCRLEKMRAIVAEFACGTLGVIPAHVTETKVRVKIPETLTAKISESNIWEEYDGRCIDCGRCNFACPTCTCYTMQDVFYTDSGKAGERRRVWASCMVNEFTDMAGGASYRKKNGQRMRFKVLHKVLDHRERYGYNMCVGCGRCDDVCPEYISFSNTIGRLGDAMAEVTQNAEE